MTVTLALICLAACTSSGRAPRVATPATPDARVGPVREEPGSPPGARLFLGMPEEGFWVSRAPDGDRVISGGVRLELSPAGEVRAAAWEVGLSRMGEPLLGALAVPARLGGGFVHWTRTHLFRSREFTGPLERVRLGGELTVRGARSGLSSVIVLADDGPRALDPGRARLSSLAEPGVSDETAVSASRAVVVDVFGRARETDDGGRSYVDLSPVAGAGVRQLLVGEGDLWLETWQGRLLVGAGGRVEPAEQSGRQGYDGGRGLQILWKGAQREQPEWTWAFQQSSPLAAAVADGAEVGDGTALAVAQSYVVRVDLATGKLVSAAADEIPSGLECQPIRAPDAVLFACAWQRYQGYGGYALRSVGGAAPEVEHVFTDDGGFVADDRGAIGFTGSCRATPRLFDPEEQARTMEASGGEPPIPPVICVRRAPGEWVEHRVDAGEGTAIAGWVPRLDGSATALALSTEPLPPPRTIAPRVVDRGDVRLVRLYQETPGWSFKRAATQGGRSGQAAPIDRRFSARDDGSIDGWLGPSAEGEPVAVGVTIDAEGIPTVHEVAPGAALTVASGAFAASITRDGDLYESVDHGRSFRLAGRSPVPPTPSSLAGCSAIGCAIGPVVRVGWGDAAVAPRVANDPPPAPEPPASARARTPILACAPRGSPVPLAALPPSPPGAHQTLSTAWGDAIEILRDAAAPEPPPVPTPAPAPPAPTPPKKGARPSPAVLRTHTLLMRPPFSPLAAVRRLNATDAGFNPQRRLPVVPLLDPKGEVDLLVVGEPRELVVAGDRVTSMPAFEPRRWMPSDGAASGGLMTADGRALVIGEVRRRVTLEDHGAGPSPPPIYLGMERDLARRRPLSLARRDDGGIGLLVLDGLAPETAGVAAIDRALGIPSALVKLAPWSSLAAADDPRCKKEADREAYTALVMIDPAAWLSLDAAALPGIALGHQGMVRVRWGRARVCLEGLEAAVTDLRRGEPGRAWSLSARWGGEKDRGAALRTADLLEELSCRVEPGP
jgi:hypothetical protein